MPKRLTTQEYKEFLAKYHPELTLLSDYNGDKNYVTVKCNKCGKVWNSKPNWIKQGVGCSNCYHIRRANELRKTRDEFIRQSRGIHGDKYGYDKVEYTNDSTPVTITCPTHGDFQQRPNKHLRGQGCPKCGDALSGFNKRLGREEFISRSKAVHGEKYIYPEDMEYVGVDVPVKIICRKHGEFWQSPYIHMKGGGCPKCRQSRLENSVMVALNSDSIEYEHQKRFEWLERQSLDFYIPSLKVGIECQGLQHFKPVPYRTAEINDEDFYKFEMIKERDIRKYFLCKTHGIEVLYLFCDGNKTIPDGFSNIYRKENVFYDIPSLISFLHSGNIEKISKKIGDIIKECIENRKNHN